MESKHTIMTRGLHLTSFLFFLFVIVSLAFPTIRLLSIGSGHASGPANQLVALLPEIFFLASVVAALLSGSYRLQKWNTIDYLVMGYAVIVVTSGLLIGKNLTAGLASIRLTYLPMLAYFVFSGLAWNTDQLVRLIRNIAAALTVAGGIGYALYFIFPSTQLYLHYLFTDRPQDEYFFIRMSSIVYTPVVFGALMSFAYLFWAWNYLKNGRPAFFLLSVFVFSCIIMSVSRGPILASGIASGAMILLTGKWKNGLLLFLGCAATIVLIGATMANLGEFLAWFYSSTGETLSGSANQTRVSLWKETANVLNKHIFGLGLGKAGHVAFQHFPEGTPGVSRESTDGWYLKLAVESGIQAIVLYAALFLAFLVTFIRSMRRKTDPLAVFLFAVFIYTSFLNVVSNGLDFGVFSYLYWAVLGIFIHLNKKTGIHSENFGSNREL